MEFFKYIDIPLDESDPCYCKSFTVDEARSDGVQDFFDEYGFVIFREVIDEELCEKTIDDMWALLKEGVPSINRGDPETWNQGWTSFGMPKKTPTKALFRPSLLRLRQHESVVECFAGVLQSDDILCSHDRWLMHRPTRLDGACRSEWATRPNVHLDMNPAEYVDPQHWEEIDWRLGNLRYGERKHQAFISENNDVHRGMGRVIQGILTLGDLPSSEDGGGTVLVPGSHKWFDEWAKKAYASGRDVVGPAQHKFGPEYNALAQRATMRPGSLLIWDQRVTHGSTVNSGGHVRYGVPLRFLRADQLGEKRARDRAATVRRKLREEGFENELTALGERVFFGGARRRKRL